VLSLCLCVSFSASVCVLSLCFCVSFSVYVYVLSICLCVSFSASVSVPLPILSSPAPPFPDFFRYQCHNAGLIKVDLFIRFLMLNQKVGAQKEAGFFSDGVSD
jgi:hypothetical protein